MRLKMSCAAVLSIRIAILVTLITVGTVLNITLEYRFENGRHPCRTASLTGPAGSPSQGMSENVSDTKAGTS